MKIPASAQHGVLAIFSLRSRAMTVMLITFVIVMTLELHYTWLTVTHAPDPSQDTDVQELQAQRGTNNRQQEKNNNKRPSRQLYLDYDTLFRDAAKGNDEGKGSNVDKGNGTEKVNGVTTGSGIKTGNGVEKGNGVKTGSDIKTGNNVRKGNGVNTGSDIKTGNDVKKENDRQHSEKKGASEKTKKSGQGDNLDEGEEAFLPFQIRKYSGQAHAKWTILDVTSGECPDGDLSPPSGWKVIVVGNLTSTMQCREPNCIMAESNSSTSKHLSKTSSYLRLKNMAYLTAISRGAVQIFDTNCQAFSQGVTRQLEFNESTKARGLMYNSTRYFNPYQHFGAWSAVPLALYRRNSVVERNSRLYYVRDFSTVYVKHGVSEWSEDIVRANKTSLNGPRFDHSTPPVYVGQRTFAPVVSSCTMYHKMAFWSLLLPCTSSNALRCHILRQYVLQRVFRELDAFSGFFNIQLSGDHLETKWADKSQPMHHQLLTDSYLNVDKLALFLDTWVCKPELKFFDCLKALAKNLQSQGFLLSNDVSLMTSWLKSLQTLGVQEPSRVRSPWRGVRKITETPVLLGSVKAYLENGGTTAVKSLEKNLVNPVKAQCVNSTSARAKSASVAQWSKPVMTDIVLVIVFNYNNKFLWKNLPYLETVHRPFFRHIVYCTPNVTELMAADRKGGMLEHVTVVEGMSHVWYLMYECLSTVASMNIQGVRGYLHIGDDTLLNTWNLLNISRDVMWMPRGFTTLAAGEQSHPWKWYYWNVGRDATLHTLSDLERISSWTPEELLKLDPRKYPKGGRMTFSQIFKADNTSYTKQMKRQQKWADCRTEPIRDEARQFLDNYVRTGRLGGQVVHRAIDLFYVPEVLRDRYVTFSRYFMRHGVVIELALPVMHHGLMKKGEVKYLGAQSLWYGDRESPNKFYDKSLAFLHPFKMHGHMQTTEGRAFFCDVYVDILFSYLKK